MISSGSKQRHLKVHLMIVMQLYFFDCDHSQGAYNFKQISTGWQKSTSWLSSCDISGEPCIHFRHRQEPVAATFPRVNCFTLDYHYKKPTPLLQAHFYSPKNRRYYAWDSQDQEVRFSSACSRCFKYKNLDRVAVHTHVPSRLSRPDMRTPAERKSVRLDDLFLFAYFSLSDSVPF